MHLLLHFNLWSQLNVNTKPLFTLPNYLLDFTLPFLAIEFHAKISAILTYLLYLTFSGVLHNYVVRI